MANKLLKFYDVRTKKSFTSSDYKTVKKGKVLMAVAKNPKTGKECWRILGRA